ncbi:hypothetical protein ACHHRT_11725 [Desulfurivibrio sp. D14AmB]
MGERVERAEKDQRQQDKTPRQATPDRVDLEHFHSDPFEERLFG